MMTQNVLSALRFLITKTGFLWIAYHSVERYIKAQYSTDYFRERTIIMTLFGLQWASPLALYLLPLVVLPWFTRSQEKTIVWSKFVPVDPLSNVIGLAFKTLTSLVLACLILSLAGPYLPEKKVDRIGEGAEVVVLVDRSRSMDNAFAIKGQLLMVSVGKSDSKRRVAKKYLQEFIDKRPDDRFGFVLFSDKALDLLPLTYNKQTIRATVDASAIGKGLSETNIAMALVLMFLLLLAHVYTAWGVRKAHE
ncbi:MAG: mxaC protein [Methylophagaceae bacterium]|jgi:mxaC protein